METQPQLQPELTDEVLLGQIDDLRVRINQSGDVAREHRLNGDNDRYEQEAFDVQGPMLDGIVCLRAIAAERGLLILEAEKNAVTTTPQAETPALGYTSDGRKITAKASVSNRIYQERRFY